MGAEKLIGQPGARIPSDRVHAVFHTELVVADRASETSRRYIDRNLTDLITSTAPPKLGRFIALAIPKPATPSNPPSRPSTA
jgi:hypothetical protein